MCRGRAHLRAPCSGLTAVLFTPVGRRSAAAARPGLVRVSLSLREFTSVCAAGGPFAVPPDP